MTKSGFTYIMTNKNKSVLYVGVTSNLKQRVSQHQNHFYPESHTARYNIEFLIYYEYFEKIIHAI
ncbi:MAG: GIY-YIG nuclease family protein, partial [Chitinophagaceae bacterium]